MRTPLTTAVVVLIAGLAAPVHAHTQLLTLNQIGEQADIIFTAAVQGKSERSYNDGAMFFTDVTFGEVTVLHVREGVQAPGGATITLSFAGGGGIRVCSVPEYEIGERYLIAAHLDGKQYRSAVIGGTQGSFRLARDEVSGMDHVLTHDGLGVVGVRNGLPLTTRPAIGVRNGLGRFATEASSISGAAGADGVAASASGAGPGSAAAEGPGASGAGAGLAPPKPLHRKRDGAAPVSRSFERPAREAMPILSLEAFTGQLLPARSMMPRAD